MVRETEQQSGADGEQRLQRPGQVWITELTDAGQKTEKQLAQLLHPDNLSHWY